ncbi:hypothetical protein F383_15304 [Gossypium arboreum]|uniref:Uncharacterized protein n=1 Tax=Gossypium arboreum TaxID=29729 RepID=A0A0B0N520_GOSAR|nr:hypothetical protein F383_15304 [Gossypium arboreum]
MNLRTLRQIGNELNHTWHIAHFTHSNSIYLCPMNHSKLVRTLG